MEERFRDRRFRRRLKDAGILPRRRLEEKSRRVRLMRRGWWRRRRSLAGRVPVRLASEMVSEVSEFMLEMMTAGPLAEMGREERVRWVRLRRRESQTPVSLCRLLTAVKERRREREEGRRGGGRRWGQLMSCKEVREGEREERAGEGREVREEEQLRRVRERR